MAYSEQIDYLKNALDEYSAEEEKLSQLYKQALKTEKIAYANSLKELNRQYQEDRNEVYADTARDERNFYNVLAERGLGFSGEAAQAKLNSNITLSNRLGELTKEKNSNTMQLGLDYAGKRSALSMEEAEKLGSILENKNQINYQIAALENDRENEAARLQAEKEMHLAELEAETEMQAAELAAKYYNSNNGTTTGSNGNSGNSGSGGGGNNGDVKEETQGYVPDITAASLAKQLVNTATSGNGYIEGENHEYLINKYLLELQEGYDINEDYYTDLIFLLKSYGYEEISLPEMRRQVITYDAKSYYKDMFEFFYDKYVVAGLSESQAKSEAYSMAQKKQLAYIYGRCNSLLEFKQCCKIIGLSDSKVNDYITSMKSNEDNGSSSGETNNNSSRLSE